MIISLFHLLKRIERKRSLSLSDSESPAFPTHVVFLLQGIILFDMPYNTLHTLFYIVALKDKISPRNAGAGVEGEVCWEGRLA